MLNEEFALFLKRGGRSKNAQSRAIKMLSEFKEFLHSNCQGKRLDAAGSNDIIAFVDAIERDSGKSAKTHLWTLGYYYQFISNKELGRLVSDLRQDRIKRVPFAIGKFRGVNADHVKRLSQAGIKNVDQMLDVAKTSIERKMLSKKTGVPLNAIVELVKLSDLSRIGAIKAIRARLYYDAGVDTPDKLASWDPSDLREMLNEFAKRTGFEGIAPLPKEVKSAVTKARKLQRIIEY
jgi:hypothetical protein